MGFIRRLFGGAMPTSPVEDAREPQPTTGKRVRRDVREDVLPPGYKRLVQGPRLEVHGESHHRADIEAAVGQRPEGHHDIVDVALVWEDHNEYDPNAIAVTLSGRTCGYLPRLTARKYRPVMEWARSQGFVPVVRGDVTGGWQLADGSWADFGIVLYLASPDKILGRPSEPPATPSSEHPWVGKVIAFTGDSRFVLGDEKLDRARSEELARAAGMEVHPRVTKKIHLLVDCDASGMSGNQRKAIEYGVPVIDEEVFWATLNVPVERLM